MEDLVTLQIFARTAELCSFSKAAASLGVKNSTVSRHIRQLEQKLGIALFNRSTRALALTEGGRTLWQQLQPALQAIEQACRNTEALNRQPQGLLRLTAPRNYARHCLLPLLPAFMQAYPDIRVDALIEDSVIHMIDQHIDLAIRIGTPQDSTLQGRRITPLQQRLVASPGYLQANGQPCTWPQVADHACLLQGLNGPVAWYGSPAAQADAAPLALTVQGRFRSNDGDALLHMALADQGIALLPDWQVEEALQQGRLQVLLDDWTVRSQREPVWVWALYPPKQTVSSKVRAFIDFCVAHLARP
ncbi:LysR family transcriptional regulator [Frateuria aurantia]|uniref:Transcriptional regulator n=1 Tax=Frateuria aurantia (strain ATCC 33424 / DSM 6220 / KCTC 2777 / LMG 1558 / NBRC 3245 / NCIMB 13370) TaxID=767434 RepID=H8L173_FRAAD|nr:LysR family transcriptional regulator [Frateuria aurantia]AFC87228.1 transcriptional regulator [Frateuria aurantia DSM 6220]